jgi:hypothetical protein
MRIRVVPALSLVLMRATINGHSNSDARRGAGIILTELHFGAL